MEGKLKFLRYFAYVIEIIVLYILCGTPALMPQIIGVKPLLLIPVALSIAVFESEIAAMIFGLVCGALCDIGTDTSIGYWTIALTIVCFIIGYCARNFFVTNFTNATIIGVLCTAALICLEFLFFQVFASAPNLGDLFLRRYLIRILYTIIFFPLLYWFNRLFRSSIKED